MIKKPLWIWVTRGHFAWASRSKLKLQWNILIVLIVGPNIH